MARAKTSKSPSASDEERKERRRAANRRSAQKSRYREMVLMDELQKTVAELTKRNAMLKEENEAFRRDLVLLKGVMEERKMRQSMEQTSPLCQRLVNPLTKDTIKAMNMIPRTPSPVESQIFLNPERIFPFEARIAQQDASALLSADNLFQAVMTGGPEHF